MLGLLPKRLLAVASILVERMKIETATLTSIALALT
jgi:hypothetical protein